MRMQENPKAFDETESISLLGGLSSEANPREDSIQAISEPVGQTGHGHAPWRGVVTVLGGGALNTYLARIRLDRSAF
jgi:hypothetical protein